MTINNLFVDLNDDLHGSYYINSRTKIYLSYEIFRLIDHTTSNTKNKNKHALLLLLMLHLLRDGTNLNFEIYSYFSISTKTWREYNVK